MNIVKIGFCLAIGWYCGKVVSTFGAGVLGEAVKDTSWYQEAVAKMEKPKTVELHDEKTQAVKNRIGFV